MTARGWRSAAALVATAVLATGIVTGCTGSGSSSACSSPSTGNVFDRCDDQGGGPDNAP